MKRLMPCLLLLPLLTSCVQAGYYYEPEFYPPPPPPPSVEVHPHAGSPYYESEHHHPHQYQPAAQARVYQGSAHSHGNIHGNTHGNIRGSVQPNVRQGTRNRVPAQPGLSHPVQPATAPVGQAKSATAIQPSQGANRSHNNVIEHR